MEELRRLSPSFPGTQVTQVEYRHDGSHPEQASQTEARGFLAVTGAEAERQKPNRQRGPEEAAQAGCPDRHPEVEERLAEFSAKKPVRERVQEHESVEQELAGRR